MSKKTEVKFEIVKRLAVLETFASGWTLEFNIVKWNDNEPKYDIRCWNEDHTKMSRGTTLFGYELDKLVDAYEEFTKE